MPGKPQRLYILLSGFIAVMLTSSLLSYSYVVSHSEADSRISQMRAADLVVTSEITHNCANYIVLGDYSGLDMYLEGTARLFDIRAINVIDAAGFPLSEVRHQKDAPPVVNTSPRPFPLPGRTDMSLSVQGDTIVVTSPIFNRNVLGWVRVTYDMEAVTLMKRGIWKRSLILGGVWIVLGLVLTLLLLRYPTRVIGRLADFARKLSALQGGQVAVPRGVLELEQMGEALNFASRELFAKERMLREERDRLKEAQRIARIGNWEFDLLTHELYLSDEIYSVFKLDGTTHPITRERFFEFVPPEDIAMLKTACAETVANRAPIELEFRLRLNVENIRHVLVRFEVFLDGEGSPLRLIGTGQDVTESRLAQFEVERAAKEWSTAMNSSEDVICLLDVNGCLLRANTAFYAVTGLTPKTAGGRHIEGILHPNGESMTCPICAAHREKRDLVAVLEADSPDNPLCKPIEIAVRVVRDEAGLPISILMSMHDLTREREVRARLLQYQEHLEELVKTRTAELDERNVELERLNKIFVGRELRMMELKEKIKALEGNGDETG